MNKFFPYFRFSALMAKFFFVFSFLLFPFILFSQKVTITPISFQKEFELKNAGMNNVLKDYTEFASSPFKKIPNGFTLSESSVFYKFDTLNCSLFIKKREDVDGLVYYRDCEDGVWCHDAYFDYKKIFKERPDINLEDLLHNRASCCDLQLPSDTASMIYKNEFVEFPSFFDLDDNLPASLISFRYVSNSEYDEFINYVKDSTIRSKLGERYGYKYYFPLESRNSKSMLNYKAKITLKTNDEWACIQDIFYPDHEKYKWKRSIDNRKVNYIFFPIHIYSNRSIFRCQKCGWNIPEDKCRMGLIQCGQKNLGYDFPTLLELSLNEKENANNIDNAVTKELQKYKSVAIIPDSLLWIFQNKYDTKYCYSIAASNLFSIDAAYFDYPVVGVNYCQAKAFLEWKTKFHNRQLMREKSKYRVLYTLPFPEEITETKKHTITLSKPDLDAYIITNREYEEFVIYTVDSIINKMKLFNYTGKSKDQVYNEIAIKTYDDGNVLRDYSEWRNNPALYSKDFTKTRIELMKDSLFYTYKDFLIPEEQIDYWKYDGIDTRKLFFQYEWIDFNAESIYHERTLSLQVYGQTPCHVKDIEDRNQFIIRENINIYPTYNAKTMSRLEESLVYKRLDELYNSVTRQEYGIIADTLDPISPNSIGTMRYEYDSLTTYKHKLYDFKSSPDSPITSITYEQAKAYYHWKNEVPYIPTKEKWEQIKQGINPYTETELEVPGPFFRYVIRIYPVRQ